MKAPLLLSMLLILPAFEADAQTRPVGGGPRITIPSHSNHFSWEGKRGGFHGVGGGIWIVEREVVRVVEKEVVRETPPPPAAVPLPEQAQGGAKAASAKPYVIGSNYDSLPGACMKMIEGGASYYYCSGEWYQQTGWGRSPLYKAVARP